MIYTNVDLTIGVNESKVNSPVVLYRGDKNVEIRFYMKGNTFIVLNTIYAQLIIHRDSAASIFSQPAEIHDNIVIFTVTEEMIDEFDEAGAYSFQVRLYDDNMNARVTLPPVQNGIIIKHPIAVENESIVELAQVDQAIAFYSDESVDEDNIFDEDNIYKKTDWKPGDVITAVRLNKMEEGLFYISKNGGGGGGGATAPYITTEIPETVMVSTGENLIFDIDFTSPNIGKGTLRAFVNDSDVLSIKIDQTQTNITIPSDKFEKGTNKVVVYVIDRVGVMSNSITFYVRYGGLEIETNFDSSLSYDVGSSIRFYFIPTSIDTSKPLKFYMEIDGVQSSIDCTSDVRTSFTFPNNLDAGRHECVYWINDGENESTKYSFNLILLDDTNIVVSSGTKTVTVEEGQQFTLDYRVYKKNESSFKTKLYIDDKLITTGSCNLEIQYYTNSTLDEGQHTIKLEATDINETVSDYILWQITITESTYAMLEPVKSGAIFISTAKNRTNSDSNRETWQGVDQDDNKVDTVLSNFTFNSENGWINNALVISGDSMVEIPISPLSENAKYGFSLDIEFLTKPIGVENAEVLSIWDDEKEVGIKITTEELIIKSAENEKRLYFTEEQYVSAMFVIDRDEKTAKIVLNGVICGGFPLSDYTAAGVKYLEDFQTNATVILGGKDRNGYCEIRNLRLYSIALGTSEQQNNYLSNFTDKTEQKAKVKFQTGDTLPTLTVYGDFSGLGKDDKKPCDIVFQSVDVTTQGESFSLTGKYSQLQYQGTSSMQYPIKNYRLNPRDEKGKVKLDPFNNGVKESRFTLKADYASSGHWQNTGLAKWINDHLYHYNENDEKSMNPKKWFDIQNGRKLTDTRETINGFPCRLILINDGSTTLNDGQHEPTPGNTKDMGVFNFNNDKSNTDTLGFDIKNFPYCASFEVASNSDTSAGAFMSYKGSGGSVEELEYIKNSFELRFPDEDDVGADYGFLGMKGDPNRGLKRVIDFTDNSSDEDFVAHFEEYFNKQYTLRYFLLVIGLGMVDNLGKNMMLDTWDGLIFYPRFYDMDTICSFNNSGVITFDTDIEMEQGYWNTSSSRLWTRVRDLFHDELVAIYKDMRQNGFDYNTLMHYFYDEQIAKIPESYYNKDYDVKYGPYATEYMGIANGSAYDHLKRWLKRRLLFTDSLYDYAPSYADSLTIRANTTEEMTIEIETYAPVYQHMSWYNNQMDKKKIDGKTAVTFTGTAQAATDQEVIIYGGSNIKRIRGISTMNPNSMLIGNATKLVELECTNAPLLTDINSNKANLSPNKYLTKVDLSGCSALGGILRLNNSPLLSEVNVKGTAITGMLFPTSIKNLGILRVPKGVTELTLNDAKTLTTLDLEEGYLLETLSLSNCNKLKSFDLSKVKNIALDNSYASEEIRLTTNQQVGLKNMATLKRLVYTPNNEVDEFNLPALKNSPDVTITSFNCPNFKEFITTAPQRISYGGSVEEIYPNKLFMANKLDLSGTQIDTVKFLCTTDIFDLKLPTTLKNFYCDSAFDLDTSKITDGGYDIVHGELIKSYTEEYGDGVKIAKLKEIELPYDKSVSVINAVSTENISVVPKTKVKLISTDEGNRGYSGAIYGRTTLDSQPKSLGVTIGEKGDFIEVEIPEGYNYIYFTYSNHFTWTAIYTELQTPNIVPTSANGSLLFNINRETLQQNAPYIWDLQGLKLNDFHTYGVNNKIHSDTKSVIDKRIKRINDHAYWNQNKGAFGFLWGQESYVALTPFKLPSNITGTITITNNINANMQNHAMNGSLETDAGKRLTGTECSWTTSEGVDCYIGLCVNNIDGLEWIQLNTNQGNWRFYINDFEIITLNDYGTDAKKYIVNLGELSTTIKGDDLVITMPKRLADYKVQIKNADITPNNYNTMLYPKLVDTTLPITGKIDYTKYKGKYLSWAFAYTTNDVERLPLDSRSQGQIINNYNKLYSTDFIDIVDVWAYKDDDFSNRATNNNITKAYIELTQDNYKTRIDEVLQWYPNCHDIYVFDNNDVTSLSEMFETGTQNYNHKQQIINFTFMENYFSQLTSLYMGFRGEKNLKTVKNIPDSVTNMSYCFEQSTNVESLNIPLNLTNASYCFAGLSKLSFHNLDLSKYTKLESMVQGFAGCNLTGKPILPSNYAGTLNQTFKNTKITETPYMPDTIKDIRNAFEGCSELTTVGNIPDNCNNYNRAFYGCSKLIIVPETGWKGDMSQAFESCSKLNQKITINSASTLDATFRECSSLSITPTLPQEMNGSMSNCFHSCNKLVTPPQTPEGVTKMMASYYNCNSLISPPIIPNNITNINSILYGTKITELTLPLDSITQYGNALYNCSLLKDITWAGKRKSDFNLNELRCPSYTQEDLKELVNDHLEDLYKDKVKISFGNNKITINNTETTL